ncbi:MAG: hypothetical protein U0T81_10125 [Saprospiraceae bacterium]
MGGFIPQYGCRPKLADDQFNNIKAIDFINESVGFMVGIQGSFKTIDSGKTWIANGTYIADFTKLDYLDELHAVALINEKHSRDGLSCDILYDYCRWWRDLE